MNSGQYILPVRPKDSANTSQTPYNLEETKQTKRKTVKPVVDGFGMLGFGTGNNLLYLHAVTGNHFAYARHLSDYLAKME